ncbi:MAG: ABC transporter substrate-binding protein [Calditrichaeota bacterium]|nr:ABC transporter substrate-binding protein [Calditrichota bacterium]
MFNRLLFLLLIVFWSKSLISQEYNKSIYPHQPSVLDEPVEFSGESGSQKNTNDIDEIRIGFFFPSKPENTFNSTINNAADLAIEEINKKGGYHDLPYRLVKRWSNDPWGAGSKEMIKLVYEDSVWAVIGSINGEATHIAEQIATKAWLPLISPISADPTLNYIRIPWIFRLPPDYQVQAKIILNKAIEEKSLNKIGLISSISHDGRIFSEEIQDVFDKQNQSLAFHFQVSMQQPDLTDILQRALTFNPDGMILFLSAVELEDFISTLQKIDCHIPVFVPWIPGFLVDSLAQSKYTNFHFLQPFSSVNNPGWDSFQQRYQSRFQTKPSVASGLIYDAIYLLKHAIDKAGLNRPAIRNAITQIDYHSAVSSQISWDNAGGNMVKPVFLK